MIPISPEQVSQNILSLFDLTKPTMPRAFNVLEGINRGDISSMIRKAISATRFWIDIYFESSDGRQRWERHGLHKKA